MNDELIKWKCDKCGAEAGSYLDANMGPASIASRLMEDHALMSPECQEIPVVLERRSEKP